MTCATGNPDHPYPTPKPVRLPPRRTNPPDRPEPPHGPSDEHIKPLGNGLPFIGAASPGPPAATPETPAPDTPARPPNAPIANASGPAPDTRPDLAGTEILVRSLYDWPERAGSAPPVQQMAEALARLGAELTVLTARPAYPELSVYPEYRNGARDRETHQGVTIRRIPIASYTPGGRLVTRLTTEGHFALRAWWLLLRMPRPDRLVTVCPSILAIAAGVLGAPRVPVHLAIVHDLQSGLAKSLEMTRVPVLASLITWLERQTLNRVDRIVTLSQGMVEAIRTIGVKTPIDIIPHGRRHPDPSPARAPRSLHRALRRQRHPAHGVLPLSFGLALVTPQELCQASQASEPSPVLE